MPSSLNCLNFLCAGKSGQIGMTADAQGAVQQAAAQILAELAAMRSTVRVLSASLPTWLSGAQTLHADPDSSLKMSHVD